MILRDVPMAGEKIDKVAFVYIKDGRILCTKSRGKDVFYMPGGKREAGETDPQVLVREMKEELESEVRSRQREPPRPQAPAKPPEAPAPPAQAPAPEPPEASKEDDVETVNMD